MAYAVDRRSMDLEFGERAHNRVDGGRYTKIAVQLNNKMVRDVALRYRWMAKKENARKTKDDLNPLRKMKDKKVNTTW
nr:uncharacterized protein LOC109161852 [Ipomoea trifida]